MQCPLIKYGEPVRVNISLASDEEINANKNFGKSFLSQCAALPQRISNFVHFVSESAAMTPVAQHAFEEEEKAGRQTYMVDIPMIFPNFKKSIIPQQTTFYATSDPEIMKKLLKPARNGEGTDDFFHIPDELNTFYIVFQKMFPDENITIEDNVLTCKGEKINFYRHLLNEALSQKAIHSSGIMDDLRDLIMDLVSNIRDQGIVPVQITKIMDIFASSVISKFLLGNPGPYAELSGAVDTVLEDVNNQFIHRSISKEQEQINQEAYKVIRDAIEISLKSKSLFTENIRIQATEQETKTTLALLYLAGQGTSSITMVRCLWELSRNPKYQEQIFNEITQNMEFRKYFEALDRGEKPVMPDGLDSMKSVHNCYLEALRLSTPAHNIARVTKNPLIVRVEKKKEEIFSKYIPKDSLIFGFNNLAARNSKNFEQPNEFLPERFENEPLNVSVFGGGVHVCPGRFLVEREIMLLLPFLVWNFQFESDDPTIKVKEVVTLSTEPVNMKFRPRSRLNDL